MLYFKSAKLCFKSIIIFKISILFQIHKTFFQIDIFSNLQNFNLNPYSYLNSTKLHFKPITYRSWLEQFRLILWNSRKNKKWAVKEVAAYFKQAPAGFCCRRVFYRVLFTFSIYIFYWNSFMYYTDAIIRSVYYML